MTQAMSGLKGMLENITAFADTVKAASAEEAADAAAQAEAMVGAAALVETAYLVASADGSFSAAEHEKLARAVSGATGGLVDEGTAQALVDGAAERKSAEGQDARIHELGGMLGERNLQRAALLMACGIAWLDRGVGTKEGLVLQALARAFGMEIHEMHKILAEAKQAVS